MKYKNPVKHRFTEDNKDEQWYRERVAKIIPSTFFTIEDFESMKLSYDIYNDNLEQLKKEFNKWCDPLEINIKTYTPTPYPIIHNKINVLKGEMIARKDEYSVVSFSNNVSQKKTEELEKNLMSKIEEDVNMFINAIKEGKNEEELAQLIEQRREEITPEDIDSKNFKTEWERFYEFARRYCDQTQSIKSLKVNSLEDLYATSRFFVFNSWRHGKPYIEVRNPLFTGYHKSGSQEYVNKGEYVYYRQAKTYGDIRQEYKQDLTKEQLDQLETYFTSTTDKRHSVINRTAHGQPKYDISSYDTELYLSTNRNNQYDKTLAEFKTSSGNSARNYNNLIWETHIEFKDFETVYFLSYEDELANRVTIPVTKKFNVPKDASSYKKENKFGVKTKAYTWVENGTQYDIEEVEVPIKREVVILGNDIYAIYRKVPYQTIDVDNPYENFNLSTFGTVVSSRNSRVISPIERILPFYMQYIYVKHKQNKEIAKYEGYVQNVDVDQIPLELAQDEEGNQINDPIKVWLTYQSTTGKNFYSGSQTKNNMPVPPTRAPGSTAQILGAAQEIFTLQQLLQLIDQEIGMALGVPPQREAQFQTNSNASDNRQALIQSYHITEPYFSKIDEVYRQVTESYIDNFRQWCKIQLESNNKLVFTYVLNDGTQELFEVTSDMLTRESLGLYLKSNSNRREYNDYMLANIQAFAQNAGEGVEAVSEILAGITSGQPLEETHRQIQIRTKQIQKAQREQQEMLQKQQLELLEKQNELEELKHQRELEKINLEQTIKGDYSLEEERIKQSANVES